MKCLNNYYMPFEGDKHKGTIIMLPYRSDTWAKGGSLAFNEFYEIIKAISNHEHVYVFVDSRIKYDYKSLNKLKNVTIIHEDYDDSWARDTSPIFLRNDLEKKLIGIDFRFNAWGGSVDGLYDDYRLDDTMSKRICIDLGYDCLSHETFILEGGSIHTNGKGVILTTKACLLSKGRNPKLTQKEIEDNVLSYLNAKEMIWLDNGIYNDETNEHVDNMACFYNEDTVLLAWPTDIEDIQYKASKSAYDLLTSKGYKVIKVLLPKPEYLKEEQVNELNKNNHSKDRCANDRLALSYINFYQGKDFVILPKFDVETDGLALKQFEELYKDKKVYQIKSTEILAAGGNIHCVTMQIPKED